MVVDSRSIMMINRNLLKIMMLPCLWLLNYSIEGARVIRELQVRLVNSNSKDCLEAVNSDRHMTIDCFSMMKISNCIPLL